MHAHVRGNLLVVQYDVGQPDVLGRNVQLGNAAVLVRIPFQLVVLPFLRWAVLGVTGVGFGTYGIWVCSACTQGALANYVI